MDLTKIFTIGGKAGLHKLVAQSANGVIVESLSDGKRFNAYASYKISSLEDISIYAKTEDIPLAEVFKSIAKGYDLKEMEIPAKEELKPELLKFLDLDEERVYESDIKKLFSWYNILIKSDILNAASLEEVKEEKKEETEGAAKA